MRKNGKFHRIATSTAELLFTRLTESMFRLAMVALGGAKSACLIVERSQGTFTYYIQRKLGRGDKKCRLSKGGCVKFTV